MKFVLWAVVAIVTVIAAIFVIGWLLPVAHVASSSAVLTRTPEQIYAIVSDVASYPKWWSEVSRIEMLPPVDGRTRFREHTSNGPIVMEVIETSAPLRFVTKIADPDQPFGGTWTFEIVPDGQASKLTITERGEVYNPAFRFMSRFVFGHTGTMNSFLSALQQHLGREN